MWQRPQTASTALRSESVSAAVTCPVQTASEPTATTPLSIRHPQTCLESPRSLLNQKAANWQDRAHFFAASLQIMRRILIDLARAHNAQKRNGGAGLVDHSTACLKIPRAPRVLPASPKLGACQEDISTLLKRILSLCRYTAGKNGRGRTPKPKNAETIAFSFN